MAKKLKDEDLVLNIIINGNKSKKEMNELERAITDTNREINTLKKVQKDLIAQGKKETDAYKATVAAIEQKNKAIAMAEARLTELRKGLKLTEMSISDLRKEQKRLTQLLNTAIPKSANAEAYKKQLDAINNRLGELTNKAKATGFTLKGMADKFNHYIGVVTAGIVTLIGLISGIQKIITTFAEFDDKVADVQKTTGLAKDEVLELNEELKKIKTRTAQEDLLGLSRVAGKLGISAKDDVLGFVKATDQIGVALAEDLGGDVEEAINQVGKLVDIFQLKGEFGIEKALLKVGSTINDLGANSTANEGYLVNFTNRMAGVAPLAGITIQQILGLGATLDQFGQTAEVSSTALSKLFMKMASDASKYSKYAGMSTGAFKKALEKDFMGTFMKVLEGVKANAGGINELADSLGDLGLDGGRVVGVLGTLANNTFILKQQLDLANKSFEAGTSLTNEFSIKNETAAAKLAMAKKAIYNMTVELGEKLYPVMTISINGFTTLVKVLSVLVGFLIENRKAITLVLTALIAYNSVVVISNFLSAESNALSKAQIAWSKLKVFWANAERAALHLISAAYLVLRGEIAAAKSEMILFNAVTKANPIAILVAILAVAVVGIAMYTNKLTAAEKAQRLLNDVQIEANKTTAEQKNKIEALQRVLADEVATRNEKLQAVKDLRELMPDHLKGYTDEEIAAGKATNAIKLYVDQLERKARIDATSKKLAELDAQRDEIARKRSEGLKGASIGDRLIAGFSKNNAEGYTKMLDNELKDVQAAQELLRKKMDKDVRDNFDFSTIDGLQAYADQLFKTLQNVKKGSKEFLKIQNELKEVNTTIAFKKANPQPGESKVVLGESDKDRKARLKAEREAAAELRKNLKIETDAENLAYQERLKAAGLFGLQRSLMTADQLEVLAALEKEHQDRINAINEKGNKVSIEKASQAQAEITKRQAAELAYRKKLINPENELIEQENDAHNLRLEKAGLFGKQREKLTAEQLKALETLEAIHRVNLNKVDAELIAKNLDDKQKAFDTELAQLRYKNFQEYNEATSFANAKKILQNKLTADELRKISTLDQARKEIKRLQLQKENELTVKFGQQLMVDLKKAIDSGVLNLEGVKLSDTLLSDDEIEILKTKFLQVSEMLSGLTTTPENKDKKSDFNFLNESNGTDIFGFTAEDWDTLFSNLEMGKVGIDEMAFAVLSLSNAYSLYSNFVAAAEKRQLQTFEKSTNQKKAALEKQLNSGQISQEVYNKKVADLDAELDKKKADIEVKQAKRERMSAMLNIINSTAQAIISIWAQVPKFDFGISAGILTGIVSGIGAAQLATVLAAPIPGKEEGGYVTREQDGKQFKAKNKGKKRGFIDETAVLVSENGTEFVASAAAVANPDVKQVLDVIDSAQRNGNVNTLNIEKLFNAKASNRVMKGRQMGGYVNDQSTAPINTISYDPEMKELLRQSISIQNKLSKQLEKPIEANVALLGKNGFNEKLDEYNKILEDNSL